VQCRSLKRVYVFCDVHYFKSKCSLHFANTRSDRTFGPKRARWGRIKMPRGWIPSQQERKWQECIESFPVVDAAWRIAWTKNLNKVGLRFGAVPIFEFYRVIGYDNRVNVKCQKPRPTPLGLGKSLGKTETHAFRSRDQDQDLYPQVSRPRPRPVTDELESSRHSRPWSRDHMTASRRSKIAWSYALKMLVALGSRIDDTPRLWQRLPKLCGQF